MGAKSVSVRSVHVLGYLRANIDHLRQAIFGLGFVRTKWRRRDILGIPIITHGRRPDFDGVEKGQGLGIIIYKYLAHHSNGG